MPDEREELCCVNCFVEPAVKAFVEFSEVQGDCDFCGSVNVRVAPVSEVVDFIDTGIARKYEDAAEHIPDESAEGGYQWDTLSVGEILLEHEQVFDDGCLDPEADLSDLIARVSSYYTVPLVTRHPFSGPGDYVEAWERFCECVKHRSRFTTFLGKQRQQPVATDGASPFGDFPEIEEPYLDELWARFDEMIPDLTRGLPANSILYRGRGGLLGGEITHEALTSPPTDRTQNGRMSPAGISYFYACEDTDTCIAEVRPYLGSELVVAEFALIQELSILDLVDLPAAVSIFDEEHYLFETEELVKPFLREFAEAIAQPIASGREALEYVPTQVFSEFIRSNYWRRSVHGIRYKSAMKQGGVSVVLFRGPEISLGPDPWLQFNGFKRVTINAIDYSYQERLSRLQHEE